VAHGQPDDSNIVGTDIVYTVSDLAELAVRQGSPAVLARSGSVLMTETWEGGLQGWRVNTAGAPCYVRLSNVAHLWNGASVAVYSTAAAWAWANVSKQVMLVTPGTHGFSLWMAGMAGDGSVFLDMTITYGGTVRQYRITIYPSTGRITYVDSLSVERTIDTIGALDDAVYEWHSFKLVVDDINQMYKSFWFGTTEYKLNVPGEPLVGVVEPNRILVRAGSYGTALSDQMLYVDGIVVTGKEV